MEDGKMMDEKETLLKEINKWLPKCREEVKKIKKVKDKEFLENAQAYISDTEHFLQKGDLVRAFEAIVWAWAWLEIGQRKKIL